MKFRRRSASVFALLLAGCGTAPSPADVAQVDASSDVTVLADGSDVAAPARNDRLNLNCVDRGSRITAEACQAALAAAVPGARFFVGPGRGCNADPNATSCVELCDPVTESNVLDCDFTRAGCAFDESEGFIIVVEVAGRRAAVEAFAGGICPVGPGVKRWARADLAELVRAAGCAAAMPDAGFGAARYVSCAAGEACAEGETCTEIALVTPRDAGYTARVCTHPCVTDSDCDARGACRSGTCTEVCGGPCALHCPQGFACDTAPGATAGVCVAAMP